MNKTLNRQCWLSPLNNCDVCNKPFGDGAHESRVMADARTPHGPWANLCDDCIDDPDLNIRFGTGLGQKYELLEIGRDEDNNPLKFWVKTDG